MILGAAYMLYLYRRMIFGAITSDDVRAMLDLNWREIVVFAPLIAVVLWMGIYPDLLPAADAAVGRPIVSIRASAASAPRRRPLVSRR